MLNWMKQYWKHIAIGTVTGILNGLFGSGGGVIVVAAMEKFLHIDAKKSHSTAVAIILMLSIVSSVFYIKNGFFDFSILLWVSGGGIIGGLIGAKVLKKIPKKWLKILFGGLIILTAIKMIW